MRAKLALVLQLGGVGECGRLIWVWSVQAQSWMRTGTHIRNQGIYNYAPLTNPMRHGRIPNRKLRNPHTIAARERFQTKPRRSPQQHHESQRLNCCNRKAAAVDQATTRIYRVGTVYYQPTSAGYLVALPDLISATKNLASKEQPLTFKSILGRKVDGQGTGSHERRVL
jgi:hypothetical protein